MTQQNPKPESDDAAFDDEALADSLAIDDAVDGRDSAAPGLPTADSPAMDAERRGLHGRDVEGEPDAGPGTAEQAADAGPGTRTGKTRGNKAKRPHRKAPWWELPALVLFAILIAVLVKSFIVQPFYIPSQSMEKTLHGCPGCSGDRILVNKPIYDFRAPHPGDIVVFNAPTGWDNDEPASTPPSNPVVRAVRGFGQLVGFVPPDGLVLVKRVIAIGGQTVKGVSEDNGKTEQIMISDTGPSGPWRTLHESYVDLDFPDTNANFGPVTVPKGRLWVMGDHRNQSADSRYHCATDGSQGSDNASCDATEATVPVSDVIGKAFVIAWPPSRWRTLGTPTTFTSAAASGALPTAGASAVVLPVYLLRRRRRGR